MAKSPEFWVYAPPRVCSKKCELVQLALGQSTLGRLKLLVTRKPTRLSY